MGNGACNGGDEHLIMVRGLVYVVPVPPPPKYPTYPSLPYPNPFVCLKSFPEKEIEVEERQQAKW